jgi:Ser/Thr protein kinase RdoA (MazF antagonist)
MATLPADGDRSLERLIPIAERFELPGPVASIQALGNGNVNDTYLVRLKANPRGSTAPPPAFVLQRINTQVFQRPDLVMRNMLAFSEHVGRKLRQGCRELEGRRWEVPSVCQARQSPDPWVEIEGGFWRAISFIDASATFDTLSGAAQAREIGFGLGMFHSLISDLPAAQLADTLEGFHVTPTYLAHYRGVLEAAVVPTSPETDFCLSFVGQRQEWASVLEDAKASGALPLRPIHGDPKINNVMLDTTTGQAIALVDLDTVKPGLVQYDIGDCLRSGCNTLGEDTRDWQAVRFDLGLCAALLEGYGSVARSFLTDTDYAYIYDAIRLIAFELGLRFFTDYLAGSTYFKTRYPTHNLDRALVQFRLTESIEAQEPAIRVIIAAMR